MLGGNRLWRHADFLKLWTGQTISVIGSQVTVIALPTIAILQLHASAAEVGLLAAAQQIAFPVLALFAGVFADRLRRRPMMIAADCVRGLAILSVPVAAGFGVLSLVQLYIVALVLGVGTVLFDISYLAYVPSLVTRDELLEANTKLEVTFSASSLVGPSLGGVLIQLIGAAQAMFADAVSFVVSVVSIIWIRQPEESPRHPTAPRPCVVPFRLSLRASEPWPGRPRFWGWRRWRPGWRAGGWSRRAEARCWQFPRPHQRTPRPGVSGLAAGAIRLARADPWGVDVYRRHLRLDLQRQPGQPAPVGDAEPIAGAHDGDDADSLLGREAGGQRGGRSDGRRLRSARHHCHRQPDRHDRDARGPGRSSRPRSPACRYRAATRDP